MDLQDLFLNEYGNSCKLSNNEIKLKECPFEEHTKSKWVFSINTKKMVYYCFACGDGEGNGGNIWKLLKHLGLDYDNSIDFYYTRKPITVKKPLIELKEVKLPEYTKFIRGERLSKLQERILMYLIERGIPEYRIFDDELGILNYELYKNVIIKSRIVIPIWMHNKIVHAIYRDYTNKSPAKYLDLPGNEKRNVLGNYDEAYENSYIRIVEGWTSAVKLDGVALLGKRLYEGQIKALKKMPNLKTLEIIMDEGAEESTFSIAKRLLSENFKVKLLFVKGQPDDYSKEELLNLSWENSEFYEQGNKWRSINKINN